ncbi:MAG TPA: hypothetical protein VME70_13435 [Mycobacteriales bacterium]|nr:hypothetical protein [Mycobacteriales bacterium]
MRLRRAAVVALGAVLVPLLAGCNTSSLDKQELVVYFNQGAPASDHVHALQACAHAAPNANPEPLTKSTLVSDQVGDVRWRIDHANDKDLALLTECLNKQPGVAGVDIPDLTD